MTAAKNLAEEVSNIYERAINGPMALNGLLYYAYADYEEGRIKYEKAHQIYTKYLEQHDIDPTLVIRLAGIHLRIVFFKFNIYFRAIFSTCDLQGELKE